ncbi:MobA/MobL family protein [Croceicoccus marinus]|uniref:MobA/MobL family protein n=1 Tax=Croceicoccus marinus TaxID=450378 RepID=A0A7G6VTL6_9SPHN|nr:MobA/MobL family protein [Croceicoccus marinus]QNE05081.1 MobA/MobL family protein [Croceicoccus marinus]
MKINPDRKCGYVEPGSAHSVSLLRISREPWLRLELQAQQERQRAAWSEAQHVKSVQRLEREAETRQRGRDRDLFWFRTKVKNWGEEQRKGYKSSASSRAIRIGATKGWMPRYSTPIRTSDELLFPFQRTVYRSAKTSKQGAGKDLVRYGAEGAHEFASGALAFFSSIGLTVEEAAEAFDQLERVNRSAAGNAKVVHHMIIQSLHELPPEEQWAMLLRYCEQVFGSQDLPYSVCLHPPSEDGDQRNWHAHVVFSYRPMVRTDQGEWQIGRALRSDLDCPEQWTRMRFLLAEELNYTCEMHGVNKRYTHLSYAATGMDYIPQVHLGAGLTAKVRRGEEVALNELNRLTVARNSALQCVRELRSVLQASAAAVSDYVRKERDAVLAAIAFPPAKSVQSAISIDIRGITLPCTPELLSKHGGLRKDVIPANDTEAVSERGSNLPAEVIAPKFPDPMPVADSSIGTGFDLELFLPVKLPESPSEPVIEPEIVAHTAPVVPQSLDAQAEEEPVGIMPSKAPIVPAVVSAGAEGDALCEWLSDPIGKAPRAIPSPVEDNDHLFSGRWHLPTFVSPKQPEQIAPVSDGSGDRAVDSRSLASDRPPQLPHPLASEHQRPSECYRLSTFDGRALRIVEPLDNRSASDLDDIEPTAPRLPEGAVDGLAKEPAARDFSTLNLSDLVDQSGPKAPAAHVQLPAPPRSTPDENEPGSRAGKQRQNEQDLETEESPTETDPGFATAQVQVLMSGKIFGE